MALEFTDGNFKQQVLDASGVVLVDFWAPWCGPCRTVGPIVDEVAEEYAGRAKVGKLNVDDSPAVVGQFGVMSIPTLIVFKDGEPVDQIMGAVPKSTITGKLDEVLSS